MKTLAVWVFAVGLILVSPFQSFAAADNVLDSSLNTLTDWNISGSNTTRYEVYDENGYKQSSIYPHDASQTYNESRLALSRNFSSYESFSISSAALVNGSQYRNSEQGFLFEDIRATWQKGDGIVPLRLNLGDYTSSLSYRTLQQNLKGIQIELQPDLHVGGIEQRHSIIGFYGMQQPDYRNMDFNRDIFNGGSWLADLSRFGMVAFHFVNNYRDNSASQGFLNTLIQNVWGVTYEKMFNVFNQNIGVEAELNGFNGDYESFQNPAGFEENKSDMGYFLKLSGASGVLFDYGFRAEQYGDHFRPHGGVITPNRRSLAWNLGGKIYQDLRLDGRFELYRDNEEHSINHIDTQLGGLTLSGPVENPFLKDLNVYFDVFRENMDSTDRTVNIRTWSYVTNLTSTLYEQWNGRLGFNFRNAEDDAYRYTVIAREYSADIGHPVSFWSLEGDARGGLAFRANSGPNEGYQVGPTASLSLGKDHHQFSVNSQYLMDDNRSSFGEDVASFSISGGYTFTYGPHRFSVDFDTFSRNPYEILKATQDYRVGFTYAFSFDKPAGTDVRDFSWKDGYRPPSSVVEKIWAESSPELTLLEGIAPGKSVADAQAFLKSRGISKASEQGDFLVYETRVFRDIKGRQRLVLEQKDGMVIRSTVLVDLDPTQNASRSEETYEKLRGFLLKRYGNPAADLHEGDFSENYSTAVKAGQLVRVTEWDAESGRVRFGIPSRFNQPVRIELQYAQQFPDARNSRWGLEQI